ncbi:hypothetical protein EON63_17585 [archaeon]|nr:MAG: hypothetical protein EON63_17585 [archaeon]
MGIGVGMGIGMGIVYVLTHPIPYHTHTSFRFRHVIEDRLAHPNNYNPEKYFQKAWSGGAFKNGRAYGVLGLEYDE